MDQETKFGTIQVDIIVKALFTLYEDYRDEYDLELSEEAINVYTQVKENDVFSTDMTDVPAILESLVEQIKANKHYRIEL